MIADFYRNEGLREAVKQYIYDCIEKKAIEKVFAREDVSHIADAKELLDEAFGQMEVEFAPKKPISNENEAR